MPQIKYISNMILEWKSNFNVFSYQKKKQEISLDLLVCKLCNFIVTFVESNTIDILIARNQWIFQNNRICEKSLRKQLLF